jgi:hypothetical protein
MVKVEEKRLVGVHGEKMDLGVSIVCDSYICTRVVVRSRALEHGLVTIVKGVRWIPEPISERTTAGYVRLA